MPRGAIGRIRSAIRNAAYDITGHAVEEMAEDGLDFIDVETAILNGRVVKTQKDDPRGTRYAVRGVGADGITFLETVGRFTERGRYLIVTAYKLVESET